MTIARHQQTLQGLIKGRRFGKPNAIRNKGREIPARERWTDYRKRKKQP